MGQYFALASTSRKEVLYSPIGIQKLFEWGANFLPRLTLGYLLQGSWNCDRIALIGDYNEKRLTWSDIGRWKEVFPEKEGAGTDGREIRIYLSLKKKGFPFAPVYFCLDRNEYISADEIGGDKTNVLGALIYLLAYSYGKEDEEAPHSWAFCKIEARETKPKGAVSVSETAKELLKADKTFKEKGIFEGWKEAMEERVSDYLNI